MAFFDTQKKMKAITFSFDDGVTQDIQLVQLLNKYGLKCTFNINSGLLGKRGIVTRPDGLKVSHYKIYPEELKWLYEGHEVAAHTLTHPRLTLLDDQEVIRQVEQDRLNLSEMIGYEVVGFAYPGGGINNDERVAELIKNNTGIKYARTVTRTDSFDMPEDLYRFSPNVSPITQYDKTFEMAKKFIDMKTDKPQMLYIWGHSFELDLESDSLVKLEKLFEYISGRDDIFYGTNKEVLL
ncbi:MAG: polysaccharide deacetylase family protein [Clostridia bacterium]|nr:polysaccharide deacetylase family protein [Clostridia bacterium]